MNAPLAPTVRRFVEAAEPGARDLHAQVVGIAEKETIACVLDRCRGNQSHAAAVLGINRNTLRNRMRAHGINAFSSERVS